MESSTQSTHLLDVGSAPANNQQRHPDRITIQVGEQRFFTTRTTLAQSTYWMARLNGRWDDADADGSYFVDSDPALFADVLAYLRSGHFPLYLNGSATTTSNTNTNTAGLGSTTSMAPGFDHAAYQALLGHASYFGIAPLEDWIRARRYEAALQTECSVELHPVPADMETPWRTSLPGGARVAHLATVSGTRKTYRCPRGIAVHDAPARCGRQCNNARGGDGQPHLYEDEPWVNVAVAKTRMVWKPEVCLGGGGEGQGKENAAEEGKGAAAIANFLQKRSVAAQGGDEFL